MATGVPHTECLRGIFHVCIKVRHIADETFLFPLSIYIQYISDYFCNESRALYLFFAVLDLTVAMFNLGDFQEDVAEVAPSIAKGKGGGKGKGENEPRYWLKVFETLPGQLLNAYGVAGFYSMSTDAVWAALVKPQRSGAMFHTEYASRDPERRGIAINRWLMAVLNFCKHQKSENVKRQNEFVLKEAVFQGVYAEIDKMYISFEYCLAPKKERQVSGNALRASIADVSDSSGGKDPKELDSHTSKVFQWITMEKSRIRMLMNFQGSGGLAYGASVHQLATACFLQHGNKYHEGDGNAVSLSEFQEAVKSRHRLGSAGISTEGATSNDFQ